MKKFGVKKLLSVLFVVAFLAAVLMMATGVSAATTGYVNADRYRLKYKIEDGKATITYVEYALDDVWEMPSIIKGYPVTAIGDSAINDNSYINSVIIPEGVKTIGVDAFESCPYLESITIPSTVTKIGLRAFANCPELREIIVAEGNRTYRSADNCLIKISTNTLVAGCKTSVIPNDGSVTVIGESAFLGCKKLKSIIIPSSVKKIGLWSFAECTKLNDIKFSEGLTTIGEYAFSQCTSLGYVTLPASVTTISNNLFNSCQNLVSIKVDAKNKSYHSAGNCLIETETGKLIRGCKTSVIPDDGSVKIIAGGAFWNCNGLKSVNIPAGVTHINSMAFDGCRSLVKVTLPKSLKRVGSSAFYNCTNLSKVYYCGTKTQFSNVYFMPGNEEVKNASVTFHDYAAATCTKGKICKLCGAEKTGTELGHIYSSDCDKTCNRCSASRTIKHKYSNACDKSCNSCGATRTVPAHKYTAVCDKSCNVCGYTRKAQAHKYSNKCDTKCNVCNATRKITHTYKTITTKATLKKNGSIVKKCTVCGYVASNTPIKYPKTIKMASTGLTYNGKVRTPAVTVKNSAGKALKKGTDYTVTYSAGRKNLGVYKVTVKMIGKYSGTKTLTFKIIPKAASINNLTPYAKGITVKLNRVLKNSTGYQIQYSTSIEFTNAKTVTIYDFEENVKNLTGLKSNTTYYIRVRTYTKVATATYYSNWSTVGFVKTK